MYGKIFDSIYDGTLGANWEALVTFQQMIVLSTADGIVDMTAGAISRRTGIPIQHIEAGIAVLESPDPESRTPDMEGVRIARLDDHRPWGWFIVNHEKYKSMKDADEKREYERDKKRRQRAKNKEMSPNVPQCPSMSHHTDTDTDKIKDIDQNEFDRSKAFDEFWTEYPRKVGKAKAEKKYKSKITTEEKHQRVIIALKNHKTTDQWKDQQFIPHPTTWLNEERWDDEVQTTPLTVEDLRAIAVQHGLRGMGRGEPLETYRAYIETELGNVA